LKPFPGKKNSPVEGGSVAIKEMKDFTWEL
jgi:hypothetical protein